MAITLPRRSDARKGRQPAAPDGSKAPEAAESKEMEKEEETSGSPEGEEGSESYRNGSKKDYRGRPKPSRQRSAKGAGNTKAPMDSDCGCGGKKGGCSCKGKKDGGMGGPGELYAPAIAAVRQKNARDASCGMRRGDSLSVHEYLAACDLGIQNQPTGYIRARLDATERLDLKCGRGSISQGEKCTKSTTQEAKPNTRRGLTGKALLTAGLAVGAGYLALKHGRSAVKEVREIGGSVKSLMGKQAKLRELQAQNKRMGLEGEGESSFTRFLDRVAPDKRRRMLERAFNKPDAKRRDSVWAEGFHP